MVIVYLKNGEKALGHEGCRVRIDEVDILDSRHDAVPIFVFHLHESGGQAALTRAISTLDPHHLWMSEIYHHLWFYRRNHSILNLSCKMM